MKYKAAGLTMVAAATALLVACGGGGGGGATTPAGVTLNGVAATGLAMANSAVSVKCASGTGSATTNTNGSYTVVVDGGALPCIVKVTGMVDGNEVSLHSIAEGTGTTATANVTPLTEIILARAAGRTPAALFETFEAAPTAVSGAALAQAITEMVSVLNTSLDVNLGTIDPFKSTLAAATTTAGTGDTHDQLLDLLKTKLDTSALATFVGQVASVGAGTGAPTLAEVMGNASAGSLANCPSALSGKYRLVEYTGAVNVVNLNFGTMKLTEDGSSLEIPITRNTSQNCEITVDSTRIVFGPAGVGAFADAERVGYIFPVQPLRLAEMTGNWEFLESGIEESNMGVHFVGKMGIATDGKATVCDYDVMANDFSVCQVDNDEGLTFSEASAGNIVMQYGDTPAVVYGFRAPNGSLVLFGSNNPNHVTAPGSFRTSFVMTRPQTVQTQAVGTKSKYWELVQTYANPATPNTTNGTLSTTYAADELTVTDATATTVTRTRGSIVDTLTLNSPIEGMRSRVQSGSITAINSRMIPGTGLSVAIDAMPSHFVSISVPRP